MHSQSRRDMVWLVLAGFFITNAILGEVTGGKLFAVGPFQLGDSTFGPVTMSIGVIPWPIVFLTTDLINEYFGKVGVRKLTFFTVALIIYAFLVLYLAMQVTAVGFSPVTDEQFNSVFGQSLWIIVGSIIAFLASQMIDVLVFWFFKNKTGGRLLWLRASGSTAISQLVDSFVIIGIAFWLPGKIQTSEFLSVAGTNYSYKLLIAIALTPLIYLAHNLIDRYLGNYEAHRLTEDAAHL